MIKKKEKRKQEDEEEKEKENVEKDSKYVSVEWYDNIVQV